MTNHRKESSVGCSGSPNGDRANVSLGGFCRPFGLARNLLLAACLLAFPLFVAAARPPDVIEIVDLTCSHCAAFAASADALASSVRAAGGLFRVAPVQPVVDGDRASVAVLAVYWVERHRGDVVAQKAVGALYAGYANHASLDDAEGVTTWLDTQGIVFTKTPSFRNEQTRSRFDRAVRLAVRAGVHDFPAIIALSPETGAMLGVVYWKGSVGRMTKQATALIFPKHHQGE